MLSFRVLFIQYSCIILRHEVFISIEVLPGN